ncbi:MAG: hypothetical protein JWN93_1016 [Hyphomicrobiales bacterium]|jgi:hypothetical protein|nr:hypothetical protein [Hyphomicrobiales bacterium]
MGFSVRACALAFALALSGAPALAAADEFAAACVARGARESACACQAKLARAGLNASERGAAVSAMRGDQDAARRQLAAMGDAKAKAFAGKMRKLGQRAKAECR